jgi:hypothetical protein
MIHFKTQQKKYHDFEQKFDKNHDTFEGNIEYESQSIYLSVLSPQ